LGEREGNCFGKQAQKEKRFRGELNPPPGREEKKGKGARAKTGGTPNLTKKRGLQPLRGGEKKVVLAGGGKKGVIDPKESMGVGKDHPRWKKEGKSQGKKRKLSLGQKGLRNRGLLTTKDSQKKKRLHG